MKSWNALSYMEFDYFTYEYYFVVSRIWKQHRSYSIPSHKLAYRSNILYCLDLYCCTFLYNFSLGTEQWRPIIRMNINYFDFKLVAGENFMKSNYLVEFIRNKCHGMSKLDFKLIDRLEICYWVPNSVSLKPLIFTIKLALN